MAIESRSAELQASQRPQPTQDPGCGPDRSHHVLPQARWLSEGMPESNPDFRALRREQNRQSCLKLQNGFCLCALYEDCRFSNKEVESNYRIWLLHIIVEAVVRGLVIPALDKCGALEACCDFNLALVLSSSWFSKLERSPGANLLRRFSLKTELSLKWSEPPVSP